MPIDRKYGRVNFTTPNKVGENEPVFIIRAKDRNSVEALRSYVDRYDELVAPNHNDQHSLEFKQSVASAIEDFEGWQSKYETKIPD